MELKETLLHEMIHAWVRLTHQKDTGQGSNSGHGSAFQAKMLHINTSAAPDYQVCSLLQYGNRYLTITYTQPQAAT